MNNSSAKQELMLSQARLEEYKKKIAGLEETNLGLGQKADTLANSLEEEGSVFRAQLRAKNEEVEVLQGGLVGVRQDYQVRSFHRNCCKVKELKREDIKKRLCCLMQVCLMLDQTRTWWLRSLLLTQRSRFTNG